jgi:hypothetical protein
VTYVIPAATTRPEMMSTARLIGASPPEPVLGTPGVADVVPFTVVDPVFLLLEVLVVFEAFVFTVAEEAGYVLFEVVLVFEFEVALVLLVPVVGAYVDEFVDGLVFCAFSILYPDPVLLV